MPEQTAIRRRRRVFAAVLAVSLLVAVASVTLSVLGGGGSVPGQPRAPAPDRPEVRSAPVPAAGAIVFRTLDRSDPQRYGHIAWAPLDRPAQPPTVAGVGCERVHFAAGRGICLSRSGSLGTGLKARLLGPGLRPQGELELRGAPSRARISPDGRYASVTAFVSGHSYADKGSFSTQTTLIDVQRAKVIADLEDFEITRGGEEFESIDFNFWGVTFSADGERFYATLASRGKTYLIEGDIEARTARTLRENVECPSLSPDGTRIAYKKLMREPGIWRYHVLDLATGRDTAARRDAPDRRPGRVARRRARALPDGRGDLGRSRPTAAAGRGVSWPRRTRPRWCDEPNQMGSPAPKQRP